MVITVGMMMYRTHPVTSGDHRGGVPLLSGPFEIFLYFALYDELPEVLQSIASEGGRRCIVSSIDGEAVAPGSISSARSRNTNGLRE
jgi:hypothetical protein